MYTWGILLAYMRRRLSSRPRYSAFWEAEYNRIFLISKPGLHQIWITICIISSAQRINLDLELETATSTRSPFF